MLRCWEDRVPLLWGASDRCCSQTELRPNVTSKQLFPFQTVPWCHDSNKHYTLSDSQQFIFGELQLEWEMDCFVQTVPLPQGWNWDWCTAPPRRVRTKARMLIRTNIVQAHLTIICHMHECTCTLSARSSFNTGLTLPQQLPHQSPPRRLRSAGTSSRGVVTRDTHISTDETLWRHRFQ